MSEQVCQRDQQKAKNQRDQSTLCEAFLDTVDLSGADILSGISSERGAQRAVGLLHDLLHAVCDGKRRHHGVAEAVYHALKHHARNGDHGILQRYRNAEPEGSYDDFTVRLQFFPA